MTVTYVARMPQLYPVIGTTDAMLSLPAFARKGEAAPEALYRLDRPAVEALREAIRRYFRATGTRPTSVRVTVPSRSQRAQQFRDEGYHLIKRAATMDADTELADALEDERQWWASLAKQHEEQARYAHLQAEECARRQAQHLLRVDAEPEAHTAVILPSAVDAVTSG